MTVGETRRNEARSGERRGGIESYGDFGSTNGAAVGGSGGEEDFGGAVVGADGAKVNGSVDAK